MMCMVATGRSWAKKGESSSDKKKFCTKILDKAKLVIKLNQKVKQTNKSEISENVI